MSENTNVSAEETINRLENELKESDGVIKTMGEAFEAVKGENDKVTEENKKLKKQLVLTRAIRDAGIATGVAAGFTAGWFMSKWLSR